jgi:hypothetical protein
VFADQFVTQLMALAEGRPSGDVRKIVNVMQEKPEILRRHLVSRNPPLDSTRALLTK